MRTRSKKTQRPPEIRAPKKLKKEHTKEVSIEELKGTPYEVKPVTYSPHLDHYICSICTCLPWKPVFTPCDHIYCQSCLHQWLEQKQTCPQDRKELTESKVKFLSVQRIAMRPLASTKIYCPRYNRYGCEWEGEFSEGDYHLNSFCLWAVVKCPWRGCNIEIQRQKLEDHLFQEHKCEHSDLKTSYEEHLKVCTEVPVKCKQSIIEGLVVGGCGELISRALMKDHQRDLCPKTHIRCQLGCDELFPREEAVEHKLQFSEAHLIADLNIKQAAMGVQVDTLEKEVRSLFLQGKCILLGGGVTPNGEGSKNVFCFWLEDFEWIRLGELPFSGGKFSLQTINQYVYLVGGYNDELKHSSAAVYKFDEGSKAWQRCCDLPEPRQNMGLVKIGDRLYKLGGYNNHKSYTDCHFYNILSDSWIAIAPMKTDRRMFSALAYHSEIYVFGGLLSNNKPTNSVEVYNTMTDQWSRAPDMPWTLNSHCAIVMNSKIYIFGGEPEPPMPLCYDPKEKKWIENKSIPQMPESVSKRGIFAFGQYLVGFGRKKVFIYGISRKNGWSAIADMPVDDLNLPGMCVWTP